MAKLNWKINYKNKTKKGNWFALQSSKGSFVGRKMVLSKNKGKKQPWSVFVSYVRKPFTIHFETKEQASKYIKGEIPNPYTKKK